MEYSILQLPLLLKDTDIAALWHHLPFLAMVYTFSLLKIIIYLLVLKVCPHQHLLVDPYFIILTPDIFISCLFSLVSLSSLSSPFYVQTVQEFALAMNDGSVLCDLLNGLPIGANVSVARPRFGTTLSAFQSKKNITTFLDSCKYSSQYSDTESVHLSSITTIYIVVFLF